MLVVVYPIKKNAKLLRYIGKERMEKTLASYFQQFGQERTTLLWFFCTDMWGLTLD